MDFIRFAITNPVKVAVGVLLILLFGFVSLFTIPIQLVPNVDQPVITVTTTWTGRSPEEVEKEIIEEQEDKLKSVSNLKKMQATAHQGRAEIELEFYIGTDMTRALQEVSDKLREVPSYPADVDQPVIKVADSASENAIAWMSLTSTDPTVDVQALYDQADKRIKPYLERIDGLAEVNVYGGREREVHIRVDPRRLAERGITFNALRNALRLENVNVSAGDIPDGRLDVRVRTVGQYDNLEDVRNTIVAYSEGGPIRIRDLAEVELTLEKRRSFVRSKGQPALAINAIRESGSNVITVMEELRERIAYVNENILPHIAPGLALTQLYDETEYIYDAIDLVLNNLWLGGSLAVLALIVFLRTIRPTVIVALAIPVSVVGTFVAMVAFGRNLNVISIAGLAFAVGMVVDAAIVVLENIDRHLGLGKKPREAAYDATREVWGAIVASTLTTLAVFVPVLMIQEEAGQLFRDIALAICAAVSLSLLVSVTVIPTASARFLRMQGEAHGFKHQFKALFGITPVLDRLARAYSNFVHWAIGSVVIRVGVVALFTFAAIGGAYLLMPPSTYLPRGNRNMVFGIMLTPPAYNIQQSELIGDRIQEGIRPYWEATTIEEAAQLPPVFDFVTGQTMTVPPIENFFFVSWGGTIFMGASSMDEQNVRPLGVVLSNAMQGSPGSFGFAEQISLFGRGLGGTNTIEVEILGTDLDNLRHSANALYMNLAPKYGFGKVRPDPLNFNLTGPELQVRIDRVRAADLGIDVAALGLGVQALVDGAIVGDYRLAGENVNLLLVRHPSYPLAPEALKMVPLAAYDETGQMITVPLGSVARIDDADAPQQIKRIEQLRAVKLIVIPPDDMPLEEASADIRQTVVQMRDQGALSPDIEVNLAGTADKLQEVRRAMLGDVGGTILETLYNFGTSRIFLALLITYLLMAALFESFLYPFVIMFTVPLATVGGFLGLATAHHFDPSQLLDVLTMLGFVILIGVVVNNAILIVHQALNFMKGLGEGEGDEKRAMAPRDAIRASVRSRIRPVFMTTTTSVSGMLPLVLMPGSGSELYKGLGSVVVGGLIVSSMFTLLVVPMLFSLVIDAKQWVYARYRFEADEFQPQPEVQPG